jgi:IS605 OrfB family transposase
LEELNIVTEGRLSTRAAADLICYFDGYVSSYSSIYRYVCSVLLKGRSNEPELLNVGGSVSKSKLNTHVQGRFRVSKRTANSIISDAKGRLKALKELKFAEQLGREVKIRELDGQVRKLDAKIKKQNPKIAANEVTVKEFRLYKKWKKSVYWKRQRINKFNLRLKRQDDLIGQGVYRMCFGTRKFFGAQRRLNENGLRSHEGWYNAFVKNRDKNIFYLGSMDERCGNQMFQLEYDFERNIFKTTVRTNNNDEKYIAGYVDFKYQREQLICQLAKNAAGARKVKEVLPDGKVKYKTVYNGDETPLSYRVVRRGNKWYLQVILTLVKDERGLATVMENGAFGLDYNDGLLVVAETNAHGNLIGMKEYWLEFHGTGNKAKSEIREVVARIVDDAKNAGKHLVVEDLDFKNKKSKQQKGGNAEYNRMLHLFDYNRYWNCLYNSCFRNNVGLIKINPKYTSKIGKASYCKTMKLSPHQAAAYVIARRGQGFNDKLTS